MDQSAKRINIAGATVDTATSLWDAFQRLQELKLERAQSGNFDDTEFAGGGLKHLSAFLVGAFLDTVVTDLKAWFEDGGHPERRDYILQLRR